MGWGAKSYSPNGNDFFSFFPQKVPPKEAILNLLELGVSAQYVSVVTAEASVRTQAKLTPPHFAQMLLPCPQINCWEVSTDGFEVAPRWVLLRCQERMERRKEEGRAFEGCNLGCPGKTSKRTPKCLSK